MKQGFRVLDSDLHTMEPDDLWPKYLDEPFRRFAPQFVRGTASAPNQPVIRIGDVEIAEMSKRARTAVVGRDLHERSFARHPHYAAAHARGYDSESHVPFNEMFLLFGQGILEPDRCKKTLELFAEKVIPRFR